MARDPAVVARSVRLFAVVAALLGAFMLAVILLSWVRLRRQRANGGGGASLPTTADLADAWSEAGRRAGAFSEPGAKDEKA